MIAWAGHRVRHLAGVVDGLVAWPAILHGLRAGADDAAIARLALGPVVRFAPGADVLLVHRLAGAVGLRDRVLFVERLPDGVAFLPHVVFVLGVANGVFAPTCSVLFHHRLANGVAAFFQDRFIAWLADGVAALVHHRLVAWLADPLRTFLNDGLVAGLVPDLGVAAGRVGAAGVHVGPRPAAARLGRGRIGRQGRQRRDER